jgi:hypothetical protein
MACEPVGTAHLQSDKWTAADALNNAVAAVYGNVGASAVLVEVRRVMAMLGVPEDARAKQWRNTGNGYQAVVPAPHPQHETQTQLAQVLRDRRRN